MNRRQTFKQLILKVRVVGKIAYLYSHIRTDCYVISYPKCGRVWVRAMLAKAFALHFGDPREIVFDPKDVIRAVPQRGPIIHFSHDDSLLIPPGVSTKQSEKRYQKYKHKKVIFLVRDPRDVLVSHYFSRTRRFNESHDLSDFVRDPLRGVDRIIEFMKGWYEHRHVPSDFLLVRYEDLHRDPASELRRILTFVNLWDVSAKVIRASVEYATFDNMRRLSLNELRDEPKIAPRDPQDPESFKIRKGEIGGYARNLSTADVKYIEERVRSKLPSVLGYTDSGA